jgi:hypothetical protein
MLMVSVAAAADAQVVPNARWRTLKTAHFSVHFTPELEEPARRAAAAAEKAYAALAQRLVPPRGPIDLVVADNVDFSNGYTYTFPTNRIIVYTRPPLDVPSLRYYDDWLSLVITHELAHVFHLDRTRGWWRVAQHVFGRAPTFFPNQYSPAWIAEGLATYYESELTGAGRVKGTYERMLVGATATAGGPPYYDEWSLASTRYPGGEMAYGYGGMFFEYLARSRGRETIERFVDRSSGTLLPITLNRAARSAFGVSFSRAWREWRDSLSAGVPVADPPLERWRDLSHRGRLAVYPRWRDSVSLVFSGYDWVSSPAAYIADTAGRVQRMNGGRRNGSDVNAPTRGGATVFAQLELTDPYHVRSDLYVQRDRRQERLTRGARLSQPDARADGAIVAVRFEPATTQLVRVSADGRAIVPLTKLSPDTQWAEPRWSPGGDRIAVTRWTRGAYADVVILDTLGRVLREITHDRAFDSSPSWSPDGAQVLFTSDRTGVAEIYMAPVEGEGEPRRLSRAELGAFYPAMSPDGAWLATARYDVTGWHIGVAPFDSSRADTPPVDSMFAGSPLPPPERDTTRARAYSPWRSLLPRYWLPLVGQTTGSGYTVGALTSGSDIVGRHSYSAQVLVDPGGPEHSFGVGYRYAGLGQPLVDLGISKTWDSRLLILDSTRTSVVGELLRPVSTVSLDFTVRRPRYRSNAYASLGGELAMRDYLTTPAPLIDSVNPYYRSEPRFWSLVGSAGWSTAQRAALGISPEDGVSLAAAGRLRWREGVGAMYSRSVSAAVNVYKSVDIAGFAHHVLAARVAGGLASGTDPGEFDIGGSSGMPVAIFPGVVIGSQRTFAVRGFSPGVRSGSRVLAGSLEYRAPLVTLRRGFGFWPLFLDRTSLTLFADAGNAWGVGGMPGARDWLASAGAELSIDAAFSYDVPYRLRFGFAAPITSPSPLRDAPASVYFQLGYAF